MKQLLLGVLVLAFMACHGGGADPGGGDKVTVRAECEEIGIATCDKLGECGAQPPGNCFDSFMADCCTGADCDQKSNATQQQVDTCRNDVNHESCDHLSVPDSCKNI